MRQLDHESSRRAASQATGPSASTFRRPAILAFRVSLGLAAFAFTASAGAATPQAPEIPTFTNVTVHDPSVVAAEDGYYAFGSHLASAKTEDWQHWTQLSTDPVPGNPLFTDPEADLDEALAWTGDNAAFWAPDAIQLNDGRYYYYYCIGRLDAPRAALGVAVSDTITGPYTDLGIIIRSGMWGQPSPDGTIYDANVHPNAVDPDVFFDKEGRLWMVYGSYSGGIFIMEMDPETGFPLPGQGYGKKLIGGYHARIEGAFMLYSPESDYYYLFLSYGGLAADGGYNIRIGRSRVPDGPFYDAAGFDLTNVAGTPGRLFDDEAIEPYGTKIMGNWQFLPLPEEPASSTTGYRSPGHNSAYYDPLTGKHLLVFHTRFVGRGEEHQVRVHQLYLNEDDWLVAAPHRYAGEALRRERRSSVPGTYKLINHGFEISPDVNTSVAIELEPNGEVSGALSGSWWFSHGNYITVTLDGIAYRGVFTTQWDNENATWLHAFSALSEDGIAIWGSEAVVSTRDPKVTELPDRNALYGETFDVMLPEPRGRRHNAYSYSIVEGPNGLTIDRVTGMLSWQPTLTQVDIPYEVTVRALNISPNDHSETRFAFELTALSPTVVRRVELDFAAASSAGLRDVNGVFTGFTTRLPGTGGALSDWDPNLLLDTENSILNITTTQADFAGGVGLANNTMPGLSLADYGFAGSGDFAVTAEFLPLPELGFVDQVGLYVGARSDAVTRAGAIRWAEPERYSTHSENGTDHSQRFFGFGLDGTDGMNVTITRTAGEWNYFIDGVEWNPPVPPTFLEGQADLTAGVFAITPLNANEKTIQLEAFTLVLATDEPNLSELEQWRILHFATIEAVGIAANWADPDCDFRSNWQEFQDGTDPLTADGELYQWLRTKLEKRPFLSSLVRLVKHIAAF